MTEIVARIEAEAQPRETRFDGGRRLVWRLWGEGPPLVLLHGGYGSWTHWIRNIRALAARFRLVVPDLPAYGDSDAPAEDPSPENLGRILAEGLAEVLAGESGFPLAGFSAGAILGAQAATRLGRRLRSLVIIGAGAQSFEVPAEPTPKPRRWSPDMPASEVAAAHRHNLAALMIADPSRIDDLAVHLQAENTRRARLNSLKLGQTGALGRALPAVAAPITAIWGEHDVFMRSRHAACAGVLRGVQPGARVQVMAGVGHWVPYEAAGRFDALLLDVLDGPGRG
ncbi:MAG: alpha/beta fold hydrolase [Proteobacteria bacterium]|nr:alpha/beta fold hydrolase [Pseudomonadota bacterium]